jgi:RimJ/RimL family protein N-acetyltransferase
VRHADVVSTTLRTDRLLLRDWRPEDREPFASMNGDPRVMEHFPALLTREQSDEFVDRASGFIVEHDWGLWAVERRADARFIGFVGLWQIPWEAPFTPAVEVGWRLAFDAWGHGYATEAATAAITYGFEQLGLDEIVSLTVPANTRSRRVMERLGLTHDPADDFDHPRLPVGHPLRRHLLYRIGRAAWFGERGAAAPTAAGRRPPTADPVEDSDR